MKTATEEMVQWREMTCEDCGDCGVLVDNSSGHILVDGIVYQVPVMEEWFLVSEDGYTVRCDECHADHIEEEDA